MNRIAMHVCVILISGVLIGLIIRSRNQASVQQPLDPPGLDMVALPLEDTELPEGWLTSFELTERSGRAVSSDDLLGQPYIASFFFTKCPSTCPMQNEKLKILEREFKGEDIRFLSISCDPEVDTPEVLSEYAARYSADPDKWLFLTGDLTYVRRVGAEIFRLPVNLRFHTDRFVLVDSRGAIVSYYEWPEPSEFERLKQDITGLLRNVSSASNQRE